VTAVKVNMVALTNADYTVVSPTQISLTVPATATTGRIYVTAAGGMAQSAVLTVVMPPTIGSFTPTSGRVGTLVTINGSNFAGTTSVKFGGVTAASFTIVSGNRITATVPSGAVTGKIQVVNAAGTATSAGTFTLLSPKLTVTGPSEAGPVRVALFPNPATEWVGVEVSGLTTRTTTTVELLDATGHVVYTVAAGEGYTRLPVTALAKGLYIVRAGGRVQRLVVE
jgi:hypothetical protein